MVDAGDGGRGASVRETVRWETMALETNGYRHRSLRTGRRPSTTPLGSDVPVALSQK
jgi:hypothetical protein